MSKQMEELMEVLSSHAEKYPMMQPCDVVKLLYQNEFGGGHLISDEKGCLQRMKEEYVSAKKQNLNEIDKTVENLPKESYIEDIGNGMCRIYLASIANEDSLKRLGEAFIKTANQHKGNLERFQRKLDVVSQNVDKLALGFSKQEFDEYMNEYAKKGYPMTSHSDVYRKRYQPSYRVISFLLAKSVF